MARRNKSYRTFEPKRKNPIETAEEQFTNSINNILNDLAYTLSGMPSFAALPKNLQQLVSQVAKGYVIMADSARAYARKGN